MDQKQKVKEEGIGKGKSRSKGSDKPEQTGKKNKNKNTSGKTKKKKPGKSRSRSKSPQRNERDSKSKKKKNPNKTRKEQRSKSPEEKSPQKAKLKKMKQKKNRGKEKHLEDQILDNLSEADQKHNNENDLRGHFPIGSRVQGFYPPDQKWYFGTVSSFTEGDMIVPLVTFDGFESFPPEPCPSGSIRTEEDALALEAEKQEEEEARKKAEQEAEADSKRLEEEAAKLMPVPIPRVSNGERLGPFGLEDLALAGIDAVERRDCKRIREYLRQAGRAENGIQASIRSSGETPFMRVVSTPGDTEMFHLFVTSKHLPPDFTSCNRIGMCALTLMMMHGRTDLVFLLLTRYKDVKVDWSKTIKPETCRGFDELSGERCRNLAKEEGFCHDNAMHVREMISLRREREARKEDGLVQFSADELEERAYGMKIDKLRFARNAVEVAAKAGYPEIGELLTGFQEGSCDDLLLAFDGIDRCAAKALAGCGSSNNEEQNEWSRVLRFEILTAMSVLEDIFKKATWNNSAKFGDAKSDDTDEITILEYMQFWRQYMLCDSRFRCRNTRKPIAGVSGLEVEIGGQLADYFARIRLCLPDGLWNVGCERAWLRIYYCVSDVYKIRQYEDLPDTSDISIVNRKELEHDISSVSFFSDSLGSWTEPLTFF